MIWPPLHR
ncbi:hypothetical protein Nmel_012768, partial [Mimus melanotis]